MLSKMGRWYLKALWWSLILMMPFFTLSIPVIGLYDWVKPWEEAVVALKKEKSDGLRWMVSSASIRSSGGNVEQYHRQRSFVILPSVFLRPTVYEFSEGTGIEQGLKVRPWDALVYLFMYAGLIAFSWFISVPKIKRLFRFPKHQPG